MERRLTATAAPAPGGEPVRTDAERAECARTENTGKATPPRMASDERDHGVVAAVHGPDRVDDVELTEHVVLSEWSPGLGESPETHMPSPVVARHGPHGADAHGAPVVEVDGERPDWLTTGVHRPSIAPRRRGWNVKPKDASIRVR